jgi:hypothetical protein
MRRIQAGNAVLNRLTCLKEVYISDRIEGVQNVIPSPFALVSGRSLPVILSEAKDLLFSPSVKYYVTPRERF